MFLVRESVKRENGQKKWSKMMKMVKRENGCSQKGNAENSVTLQKTSRNVAFIKIKLKIYVTHSKLAGNLFLMQYRWKKRNSTAHKPKHAFPAIQLKEAYLHTHAKKHFYVTQSSNQPSLATNALKHVFDK